MSKVGKVNWSTAGWNWLELIVNGASVRQDERHREERQADGDRGRVGEEDRASPGGTEVQEGALARSSKSAPAGNSIRAVQATCWYSWSAPLRRSLRRAFRRVWMPTLDSRAQRADQRLAPGYAAPEWSGVHQEMAAKPGFGPPVGILDGDRLCAQTLHVLDVVAESDLAIGTGHLDAREVSVLFAELRRRRLQRVMVAHPDFLRQGIGIEEHTPPYRHAAADSGGLRGRLPGGASPGSRCVICAELRPGASVRRAGPSPCGVRPAPRCSGRSRR